MKQLERMVFAVLVSLFFLGGMTGCGSKTAQQSLLDSNKTNIERLANLYVMYQAKNYFEGPEDEAQFKAFIGGLSSEKLASMGIEGDVNELFFNEEDGAPFKIRYGVPGSSRGGTKAVIFETNARDNGKRLVAFTSMVQKLVEDDEYEKLWNGEGDTEQSGDR